MPIFNVYTLCPTDGFKWISLPSQRTKGHVGSTVHIKWHYECNDFGFSRIYYNNRHLFSRKANKQYYYALKSVVPHFSVIGGSNVTIIIPDIDKNKSGSYCCEVECDRGDKDEACTILVIYALPRINYLTSHFYGRQGDSVTLRCNASGYPAPRITWIHKNTNKTIANSSATSFNITDKGSGGKYCCHVSNGFGNETNCTSLEVIALPRINNLTSHLSGNQGDSIPLRCNASGNPAPRVTWIHKDTNRTIANFSVTSFNITGKESGGEYCCHVSNRFGNEINCTSIEVIEYQPIDTELTSQINCTTANKTFKILCKADASPSVQYFIQQGNKTMVNSSDGNATITTSENGYLNFSCIAKNKFGQGKTVHLEIPICRK
ncbi:neurotrimin-like [Actinia tenebrosa]|uniref:Neurotrimin-like n=1 Tax=Actinia tenebrosa TaxID=6105 RepID=A0A6P8HF16_ACTTE|nr:neurotrimin-like [Actinia tenebrosa]